VSAGFQQGFGNMRPYGTSSLIVLVSFAEYVGLKLLSVFTYTHYGHSFYGVFEADG
jgi:hypothetical protein